MNAHQRPQSYAAPIQSHVPTSDYERNFVGMFGEREDRYCAGCGRLPAWCECIVEIHDEEREKRLQGF